MEGDDTAARHASWRLEVLPCFVTCSGDLPYGGLLQPLPELVCTHRATVPGCFFREALFGSRCLW
jgi:hypothetical protein